MKLIRVIAREKIISPTGNLCNDKAFKALDGYYEQVFSVEDNYNKDLFLSKLTEEMPELNNPIFEIIEIKEN